MKMIFDAEENRYLFVREYGTKSRYINDFHQQSVERCIKHIEQKKHIPINVEEEIEKIRAMHEDLKRRNLYLRDSHFNMI